jgi:hypothetical protein
MSLWLCKLLFINFLRLLQLRLGDFEIAIFDRAEKARLITFVAAMSAIPTSVGNLYLGFPWFGGQG